MKTAEQKMLAQLEEIDRLDKLSDRLDDEGKEDEAMDTYHKMWELVDEVATLICKSTFGKIDEMTAKRMVVHQREKLIALCKRFAG